MKKSTFFLLTLTWATAVVGAKDGTSHQALRTVGKKAIRELSKKNPRAMQQRPKSRMFCMSRKPNKRHMSVAPRKPPTAVQVSIVVPPVKAPSKPRTKAPIKPPTKAPVKTPTEEPTKEPVEQPIKVFTRPPTKETTLEPTKPPAKRPTTQPTKLPTKAPTKATIEAPTKGPTEPPTKPRTEPPVKAATNSPAKAPTKSSSKAPTKQPTKAATKPPLKAATKSPVKAPTKPPFKAPAKQPVKPSTKAPIKPPVPLPVQTSTKPPFNAPIKPPKKRPIPAPIKIPTKKPMNAPTAKPAVQLPPKVPSVAQPKQVPTPVAAPKPTPLAVAPVPASKSTSVVLPSSFILGKLMSSKDGLRLSQGLTAKIVARTGSPIAFTSGDAPKSTSSSKFHRNPDGAASFSLDGDRFVYVSNSEEDAGKGGVYALEFDGEGRTRDYKALLTGTRRNCNGGKTPWNTWVSCEEDKGGQCWQVDPTGKRPPQKTLIGGKEGGFFEAFTYDIRNPSSPSFFVTEDQPNGALRRFRPNSKLPLDWNMLHAGGTLDYLQFLPGKKFQWTGSLSTGRQSANDYFKNAEGIAHRDGMLKFVSKERREMFRLHLDQMTYTVTSTSTSGLPGGGRFEGEPDHLLATVDGIMYMTEDGGATPGVFIYDGSKYVALLESDYSGDETTGVAFSPDRRFLLFCIQERGLMFQVSRTDGRPFDGGRIL